MQEILVEPIKMQAPKIVLVHNHPSGNPTPSGADIELTKKIFNMAKMFNIELVDHIVIGNNTFSSIISTLLTKDGKI